MKLIKFVPNALSCLRLLTSPCVAYLAMQSNWKLALILSMFLILTDMLDGEIARHFSVTSAFGQFVDPVADYVSAVSIIAGLLVFGNPPAWLPAGIGVYAVIAVSRLFLPRKSLAGRVAGAVALPCWAFLLGCILYCYAKLAFPNASSWAVVSSEMTLYLTICWLKRKRIINWIGTR